MPSASLMLSSFARGGQSVWPGRKTTAGYDAFTRQLVQFFSQRQRLEKNNKLAGHTASDGVWPAGATTFSTTIETSSSDALQWGVVRITAGDAVSTARLTSWAKNRDDSIEAGRGHAISQWSPFAENANTTYFVGPDPSVPVTVTLQIDTAPAADTPIVVELLEANEQFLFDAVLEVAAKIESALRAAKQRAARRVAKRQKRAGWGSRAKSALKKLASRLNPLRLFGVSAVGAVQLDQGYLGSELAGALDELREEMLSGLAGALADYEEALQDEMMGALASLMDGGRIEFDGPEIGLSDVLFADQEDE